MLQIVEVKTHKQRKEFIELPLRMYKGNEYFVPPLYGDEMAMLKGGRSYIYSDTCDSVFFLAVKDGKTVGRIQGILQKQYNELKGAKQIRFTRFDCEDDAETARALFDAVENWGRSLGMEEIVGPLGYSDLEREGLLIEGFDYLSTFEEQYNYPYYQTLIENLGYEKDVDWVESRLFKAEEFDSRFQKFFDEAMNRYNLHLADPKLSKSKFIQKYKDGIFECLDECYRDLYGTVPFTEKMKQSIIDQFMLILNRDYIAVICDENEKVVAFGLCIPGVGKAVQKSGGRLTPAGLIRLLKAAKNPDSIDLALVGILPQYRRRGLNAFALLEVQNFLSKKGVQYCETNLNLETNTAILSQWRHFPHITHKRRRAYKKSL